MELQMQDSFSDILKKYRYDNNLSQNDFVDILSSNNGFLSKLDAVTLSRWENEKTAPSLEKKIMVMRKLDLLVPYLYDIRGFNTKTKLEKSLNIRFGFEINKYKQLNNSKNMGNIRFELLKNKKDLHENIKQYLTYQEKEYCNICNKWPASIGCWHLDNQIEAFFIHIYTNDNIYTQGHSESWSNLYKKEIDNNINSIVLLDQVTSTRTFYKLSFLYLFDSIIKNNHLEYIFITINTDYFLKLSLSLGFNTIATVTDPLKDINNHMDLKFTCILKINAIKLLSNKDFLFFCLKNYYDFKKNAPKLLNLIYDASANISKFNNVM